MRRIVVVIHPEDRFDGRYYLHGIADAWLARGDEVVAISDLADRVDGDVSFLHTDVSRAPSSLVDLALSYPVALNARVVDITKRMVSRNLVCSPLEFDGAVMVKSDDNARGWRELAAETHGEGMTHLKVETPGYDVYESALDVPDTVWSDPSLVVERFRPEIVDGYYCVRAWTFLGDKETVHLGYGTSPMVKLSHLVRREFIDDVPDDLRAMREELGFDFGRFDYVISEGETVLFDTNRTPAGGQSPGNPSRYHRYALLADGLHSLLT